MPRQVIKGLDYRELMKHFGIEPAESGEGKDWRPLKDWLNAQRYVDDINGPAWPSDIVRDCRLFLSLLRRNATKGYMRPFYEGLHRVEDDFTFMQMFTHCVGFMWV